MIGARVEADIADVELEVLVPSHVATLSRQTPWVVVKRHSQDQRTRRYNNAHSAVPSFWPMMGSGMISGEPGCGHFVGLAEKATSTRHVDVAPSSWLVWNCRTFDIPVPNAFHLRDELVSCGSR